MIKPTANSEIDNKGQTEIQKVKLFISYAHEDMAFAEKLYKDLTKEGIPVWKGSEGILPGQRWKSVIEQAIKECTHFIALFSSNSISKKGFFQKELKMAMDVMEELPDSQTFFIPARLDESEPFQEKLKEIHWVDLFPSYEDGLKKILHVLTPKSEIGKEKQSEKLIPSKKSDKVLEIKRKPSFQREPITIPENKFVKMNGMFAPVQDQDFIKWINELGFKYNPFQFFDGSSDRFNHFIDPIHFDRMMEPRSILVVGPEGWGKTVCRRLLENQLRKKKQFAITLEEKYLFPSNTSSKEPSSSLYSFLINSITQQVVLDILKYLFGEPEIFESVLEKSVSFKAVICSLPFNFISSMIEQQMYTNKTGLTCNDIIKANKEDSLENLLIGKTKNQQSEIRQCSVLMKICQEDKTNSNSSEIFNELTKILNTSGFNALYIFIENLPRDHVENLYSNLNIHAKGVYYKLFFPYNINLDKVKGGWDVIEIDWPFEKKLEILKKRLEEASPDNIPSPFNSISQIFWEKGIGNNLDEKIAQSSNSPAEILRRTGEVLFELYRQKDYALIDNEKILRLLSNKPLKTSKKIPGKKTELHILHISDIHALDEDQTRRQFAALANDLKLNLRVDKLNYMLITGDISSTAKKKEYDIAEKGVKQIIEQFGLKKENIIIAPGNHDLDWNSTEKSYKFISMHKCPKEISKNEKDIWIRAGDIGYLKRCTNSHYKKRFDNFRRFYKNICNDEYPEENEAQGIIHIFGDDRILFLSLNSSWNIDNFRRKQASINMNALDKSLKKLAAKWSEYQAWLKIAVWHHPVTTLEAMNNEFMQNLALHNFDICMHGHVHKAKQNFYRFDEVRKIRIIGAGAFGAPISELPLHISHQYHLLTIRKNKIRVDTRKKDSPDGIWVADPRWGDINLNPKPYYEFEYRRGKNE